MLGDKEKAEIQKIFSALISPVKLINFTQTLECQFCTETRGLLTELAALSDKLTLEVYNFQIDTEKVKQYNIDKIPATIVEGERDYGIRFYGAPAGYEFATLLGTITIVSKRDPGLPEPVRLKLKQVENPVHLQVFTTPTCPYCPAMVAMAHRFTMENNMIRSDMVEGIEFPHLFQKYDVMGVPRTVINEKFFVDGLVPETVLVDEILKAANAPPEPPPAAAPEPPQAAPPPANPEKPVF